MRGEACYRLIERSRHFGAFHIATTRVMQSPCSPSQSENTIDRALEYTIQNTLRTLRPA